MLHSRAPLRIKVSDVGPTLIIRVDDNRMPCKRRPMLARTSE